MRTNLGSPLLFALAVVLGTAASCVIPVAPEDAAAPVQPQPAAPPAAASTQPQPEGPGAHAEPIDGSGAGLCEEVCAHLAACELAGAEDCLSGCLVAAANDPEGAAEHLGLVVRSSCDAIAEAFAATASGESDGSDTVTDPYADAEVDLDVDPAGHASEESAGRWVSTDWVNYTNAAMVSADFHLDVVLDLDGTFRGTWSRYICIVQAYGIFSCSKGPVEGTASGRIIPDGRGDIALQHVGHSTLTWTATDASITLELPRDWQSDRILFRSTVKR